ncbi:hypothetical protein [Streptomyces sp. NPDC059063]|uniref:hypothetical protein n=1 Tax=unclassified Streptomyces TaxID=2593676 RepID=UPI0036C22B08
MTQDTHAKAPDSPAPWVLWLDERLIGPGARAADRVTCYGTAAAGSVLATVLLAMDADPSWISTTVVAVVAFDLFGGAAVNATAAAKRQFHRPGRTARHHLGFVAGHVQPFLLALAVPGFGWGAAAVVYAIVLGGAVVVTAVPGEVRRPAAFGVTVLAVAAATPVAVPDELAWLAPVLCVKLLIGHLLPESWPPSRRESRV